MERALGPWIVAVFLVVAAPASAQETVAPGATGEGEVAPGTGQHAGGNTATGPGGTAPDHAATLEEEQSAAGGGRPAHPVGNEPYRAAGANEVRDDDFTHKHQVSFRLGLGGTAYFAIKTSHGPYCDGTGETFCRGLGVGIFDGEIAFAPTDGLELTSLIQVGFARDPLQNTLPVIVGLGVRVYPTPHERVKPFLGVRGVLKYLDGRSITDVIGTNISNWDGGIRLELGLQVEITRAVGLYAQVAASIFFVNDFTIPFDFTGGAQVRFP